MMTSCTNKRGNQSSRTSGKRTNDFAINKIDVKPNPEKIKEK
jgi:hypothetical protein